MKTRGVVAVELALLLTATQAVLPQLVTAATTTQVGQSYEIVASLDVTTGRLEAVETLTLTNRARHEIDHLNLSAVPRALGYLAMDGSVTVDDTPVEISWTTSINMRLPLPEPLAAGETAVISIPFQLNVGTSGGPFTARLSRENGVLSFGQWFPIISTEHEIHGIGDPQISFTAESIRLDLATTTPLPRDAVACPGLTAAPATTGMEWRCEVENVRDFSFVVNPAFTLTTRQVDGVTIRVYTQTVSGAVTADKAQAALIGLNSAFGPYPWPDLVLAEVGTGGGFSMEYPRAIHLTRDKVVDDYVINHEVAHQWFYAQVGNEQQREPWLDEGLADFGARLLMGIGENQCSARDIDSDVFAWPAGPTSGGDWTSCDGYFHAVFYKSTEFLNAVRAAMGEDAFFGAMREYVADNQFGFVTTRELLDHLAYSTDADLLPLYQAYLAEYDTVGVKARPTFAIKSGVVPTPA